MKTSLTLLFSAILFCLKAQSDTLYLSDGRTAAVSRLKVYSDRVTFVLNGYDRFIYKTNITGMKVREQKVLPSGEIGWQYTTDLTKIQGSGWPDFKDSKYYLQQAGWQGITAGIAMAGGALATFIGAQIGDQGTYYAGYAFMTAGFAFIIPTSVFLVKAGKQKDFRQF